MKHNFLQTEKRKKRKKTGLNKGRKEERKIDRKEEEVVKIKNA